MKKMIIFLGLLSSVSGCDYLRALFFSAEEPAALVGEFPERNRDHYEAVSQKFMIASQGVETTQAARAMFLAGGNIYDAFAAASFAISVERPQSTGLGGGGFLVAFNANTQESLAVDFREKAPLRASRDMYLDAEGEVVKNLSREGALASGVPGLVKGVLEIHAKYGKLSRQEVMEPAIRLAENGFALYAHMEAAIESKKDLLWENEEIRKVFFREDGTPKKVGDTVRQPMLASTLSLIAQHGHKVFYSGELAKKIATLQKKKGGRITEDDLSNYDVIYREPLKADFMGYTMISMPPPSSGGTHLAQILRLVEPLPHENPYDPSTINQTIAAMHVAYRDRARYMGDSDFVRDGVPVRELLGDEYLNQMRQAILDNEVLDLKGLEESEKYSRLQPESPETSHFTIADANGNVLSSTQTVNGWFGSGVFVEGFVLNNQMDDFSAKPGVPNMFGLVGGDENAIESNKRPLSSMSPTIFLKNGRPRLSLGTPAGSRIINCIALVSLNYLRFGMSLWDAVAALRYHHQWQPNQVWVEEPGFGETLQTQLTQSGHKIEKQGLGCKVQAVAIEEDQLRGVTDPRGQGLVAGDLPIPLDTHQDLNGMEKVDQD